MALPLAGAQCKCKEVPESDTNNPSVALWVNGREMVNTDELNSPVTMTISEGKTFSVMIAASDQGYVKESALIWKYYVDQGGIGQLVQPMIVPNDYSDCPMLTRLKNTKFVWDNQNRTYKFSGTALDFHGNRSTTPELTVIHRN
jgi:hypothetical protein